MEHSQVIRRALRRTYMPFFGHFGRFTPVQELAIPPILERRNVVVISPAASGKTEAVVAPVLENLFARDGFDPATRRINVLYVSPTRALVNDLYRRLFDAVSYLNLAIGIKTGDRPHLTSTGQPNLLLTTPESFDSLLTRHPVFFNDLKAVVLDEIHLVDNTPRGDQLRILLNRLRRIQHDLQYCALSATIDDQKIGHRYFPDPVVCALSAPREIEYALIPAKGFEARLLDLVRERAFRKILIFFNARSLAEGFSQRLSRSPFAGSVLVHHASLPRPRREEVEEAMNRSGRAILCATSTLELGIDIGSVDCVVLFRPPFNVSSLLQRIGRGNRRTQTLFAAGVHTSDWERAVFETFFACARAGQLYERQYAAALSVIPQQIYSYLHQRRRIGTTMKCLHQIMGPVYGAEVVDHILRHLYEAGRVQEARPGVYFNAPRLEKKIDWGKIHSNIAETSFGEYDVFDVGLGQRIGRIFHLRERFVLGGRCWQIVRIDEREKKVYAQYVGDAPAVAKIFEGKGAGSYNYRLAPLIKQRCLPDLEPHEFPCTVEAAGTSILHLFGALYGSILADGLGHDGIEAMDVGGKLLVLGGQVLEGDRFPRPGIQAVRKVVQDNIRRLEDALGSGAFFYDLPVEYQIEDLYQNMDMPGFLEFIGSLTLVNMDPERFRAVARSLE